MLPALRAAAQDPERFRRAFSKCLLTPLYLLLIYGVVKAVGLVTPAGDGTRTPVAAVRRS